MNYLSCYFAGGLGNQLFQAAHVVAQSKKTNSIPIFSKDRYQTSKYTDNILKNLKFSNGIKFDLTIKIENFNFEFIDPPVDKNVIFKGYFQSDKNFYGFDEYIRELFQPPNEFKEKIYLKYPEIKKDVTSIHVRRGDYLELSTVHPVITKEYINEALKLLNNKNKIFVFSNDKDWCVQNLEFEHTIIQEIDYEELWIMSMCKDHIISNSTFSWWGSFLCKNPGKVIAPHKWFGPQGEKNFQDIYRNNFIII